MTGVPWQRCQSHTISSAEASAQDGQTFGSGPRPPSRLRRRRACRGRAATEGRRRSLPKDRSATRSLFRGPLPEALTVLPIPAAHQRRLRTTDCLERLNQEIKRSTRVATLLPNEASLLRLASAGLAEISDDWETERAYPNREPDDPPLTTAICRTGVAGVVFPPWPPREPGMSARPAGWACPCPLEVHTA